MTGRSITAVVVGGVAAAVGFVALVMASLPTEHRDADGYYIDDPFTFARPTRAIVTDDIDIMKGIYRPLADDAFVLFITADPVEFRMQGTAAGPNSLFMGVAPTAAVDGYLDGVAHDKIAVLERHDESKEILDVQYTVHEGSGTPNAPGTETFWVVSVEGTGPQTLDWTLEPGDWTAVMMNADASSGVEAEVAFGAAPQSDIESISRIGSTAALIALVGGAALAIYGLVRR
jgi:hypothetical protein